MREIEKWINVTQEQAKEIDGLKQDQLNMVGNYEKRKQAFIEWLKSEHRAHAKHSDVWEDACRMMLRNAIDKAKEML